MSDELKKKISEGMTRYHASGVGKLKGKVRHVDGKVWKVKETNPNNDRKDRLSNKVHVPSDSLGD